MDEDAVLPYVDGEITSEEHHKAEAAVKEEMLKVTKRRRVTAPQVSLPALAALELARVEAELPPPDDLKDTLMGGRLVAPVSTRLDPRRARENYAAACAATEAARSRLEGAEMLARYGESTWRTSNERLEKALNWVEDQERRVERQVNELHERRRLDQLVVAARLTALRTQEDRLLSGAASGGDN